MYLKKLSNADKIIKIIKYIKIINKNNTKYLKKINFAKKYINKLLLK